MKNLLLFATQEEAEIAQQAIRDEGSIAFAEQLADDPRYTVDAQGRVVDATTGKVLIDRYANPTELADGRWAIADPSTEDWMGTRVRQGAISRAAADQANEAFGRRTKAKIPGRPPASVPASEIVFKETPE